ncbi:DUF4142 domain-containing protein [Saccharothrix obliqua]|uniref:DUF4142 domain-containing protein n=1 Tax=Saccharothrix obliqua TaxID=2861747 RepID=UPI001C5E36F3|nr:DUF4142 domain-containing protein [Saccharothrix obliqua]MBW4718105.1 DUF4142 domain-containing protein [Saccharothrix obliqua]
MPTRSAVIRRATRRVLALLAVVAMGVVFPTAALAHDQVSTVDVDPVRGDEDRADRDTPWGPLSQYDRNLLINVRWANLWEGPTSRQVAERSTNSRVRAVARQLSEEHHVLDEMVGRTVAQLGMPLPDSPTPLQQAWQEEILGKDGHDADDAWANLTREAHGTIFLLIAQVRSATRNDVMRSFAQTANEYVMRHMTLLESTGLVRASSLYVGSTDGAPHQPLPGRGEVFLGIALALLAIVGTFFVVRLFARYEPRAAG